MVAGSDWLLQFERNPQRDTECSAKRNIPSRRLRAAFSRTIQRVILGSTNCFLPCVIRSHIVYQYTIECLADDSRSSIPGRGDTYT